jgi:hypothetical protein
MSAPVRIGLFAALLALVFAGAALAGSALDPDVGEEAGHGESDAQRADTHGEGEAEAEAGDDHAAGGDDHAGTDQAAQAAAPGLAQAEGGLRLVVDQPAKASAEQQLRFRIVNDDRATVQNFDVEHARRMHLIVVRRDLTGFQHLHPKQTADGAWEVPLRLPEAGSYRLFADFTRDGESHTLGTDLHVDGAFAARELPHPETTATTDGGYEVRLQGKGGEVRFTVFKDGERVRDIQPYLGARGHLVALREGDLAYLHVHPESDASEGSDIRFGVEYPSAGRYRLFLQFKHDGEIHTAAFTREVGVGHGH